MPTLKQYLTRLGTRLLMASPTIGVQAATPTAGELVDALNGVFGKQVGSRALHAKGVCVEGTFYHDAQVLAVTARAQQAG